MARINVNLNDVDSGGGFPILPDGLFEVEIQESSKIVETSGAPMIKWIGKILDGEFEGKFISWNTSLSPAALWNLKAMMEKTDVEWDDEGFELEDVYDEVIFVQNKSGGTYKDKSGNDKPTNEIIGYYSAKEAAAFDQKEN